MAELQKQPEAPAPMVAPYSAELIVNKVSSWEWISKQKKFRSGINRTRAFALGNVEEVMSFVPLNPGETVEGFKTKTKGYRGLVTKILQAYLDGIAGLPVDRSVPNFPDFDLSVYEENLDIHKIQMKTEIGGTCAVRPFINLNGGVSYETFEATQLCPLTQGEDLVALGLVYGEENSTVEVWSPYTYSIFHKGTHQFTDINPYGLIPVSIFRAGINDQDWFGVSDLSAPVNNNISVIKMLTDLQQLARDQSYSWLFYKGPLPDKTDDPSGQSSPITQLNVGPDRMGVIDEDADIFTVTPEASIKEIQDAADILAEKTFEDASVASVVQSAQAESGYALKVKRAPYLNKMRTKRTLFQESDERLIEIAALMRDVGFTGTPATLNENFSVTTSYDESKLTPEDPSSQKEQESFDIEQNVMSRIDLIQKRNGVSRDEAIEIAARIDEDNGGTPTNDE